MNLDSLMDEKNKIVDKLDSLQFNFQKSGGKGSLSLAENFPVPDVIPTGIPEIDNQILAIGGLAIGRMIEIAGETNAGKSTLALNFCREAIKLGKSVVIAENEGSFTYEYAEKIGMAKDSYMLFRGSELDGREYLEEILRLIEVGFDVIVLDSITGVIDRKVSDAGLVDANLYTQFSTAKLTKNFMEMLKGGWKGKTKENKDKIIKMIDYGPVLIVINHLKEKFNITGFGPPKKESPGGEDIKFLYTHRLFLERLGMSKDKDENGDPIYTRVKVTCHKAKLSPSGRSTVMHIDNRDGRFLSDKTAIVARAVAKKLIVVEGAWIKVHYGIFEDSTAYFDEIEEIIESDMKWHGKEEFLTFCERWPQIMNFIWGF